MAVVDWCCIHGIHKEKLDGYKVHALYDDRFVNATQKRFSTYLLFADCECRYCRCFLVFEFTGNLLVFLVISLNGPPLSFNQAYPEYKKSCFAYIYYPSASQNPPGAPFFPDFFFQKTSKRGFCSYFPVPRCILLVLVVASIRDPIPLNTNLSVQTNYS